MQKTIINMMLVGSVLFSFNLTAAPSEMELQDYRFRYESKKDHDRLVLQFQRKSGFGTPATKVMQDSSAGEATIEVNDASIQGAIPEAAINGSYEAISHYLGPITINTDTPQAGFSIRAYIKNPNTKIDAFWLDNPSRLVIDVFPVNSPRAKGRDSSEPSRSTASKKDVVKCPAQEETPSFLCFPASARVGLKVKFSSVYLKKTEVQAIPVNLGTHPSDVGVAADAIVCYPKFTRVNPGFAYEAINDVFVEQATEPTLNQSNVQQPPQQGMMRQQPMPGGQELLMRNPSATQDPALNMPFQGDENTLPLPPSQNAPSFLLPPKGR